MPDFADLTLLPLCVGLTVLGLIGSWLAWRRRGATSGVRGVAWALLPVSLYLTGLLELVWDIVKAASDWIVQLVFSPTVWSGFALLGVSVVLYVVSGVVRSRTGGTEAKEPKQVKQPRAAKGEVTGSGPAPAKAAPKKATDDSSEFDEIEDILKRHGIN